MVSDLVARILAAPEGSRELSDEVLVALGWRTLGTVGADEVEMWESPGGLVTTNPPDPTDSLDDALALVSPEHWFAVQQRKNTVRFQRLDNGEYGWKSHDRPMVGKEPRPPYYAALGRHDSPKKEVAAYGTAATPMLALCAAILQVRGS